MDTNQAPPSGILADVRVTISSDTMLSDKFLALSAGTPDGPKLAGTSKTMEQLVKHINEGKSPMPGFKNQLSEKEVQALAEYIKTLPAN